MNNLLSSMASLAAPDTKKIRQASVTQFTVRFQLQTYDVGS